MLNLTSTGSPHLFPMFSEPLGHGISSHLKEIEEFELAHAQFGPGPGRGRAWGMGRRCGAVVDDKDLGGQENGDLLGESHVWDPT